MENNGVANNSNGENNGGVRMIHVNDVFGKNAGKVWGELRERNRQTVKEIARKTRLSENNVHGALGWLAKEGKIQIHGKKFVLIE